MGTLDIFGVIVGGIIVGGIILPVVFIMWAGWSYYQCEYVKECCGYECECIEDCKLSRAEFVRYISGYRAEEQCMCLIDGIVQNIWGSQRG